MIARRPFLGMVVGGFLAASCRGDSANIGVRVANAPRRQGDPLYVPEARAHLVAVPDEERAGLLRVLPERLHVGVEAGVRAVPALPRRGLPSPVV